MPRLGHASGENQALQLRQQLQRIDVARPQHTEMAVVQGCQLRLIETLDDGQNRRVHEADRRVGVASENLANAAVISDEQCLHSVAAILDIVQELNECMRAYMSLEKVIDLDDHWSRDNALFIAHAQKIDALLMMSIAPIKNGNDRAGIKYQRQL
jgi:hypothetical protein